MQWLRLNKDDQLQIRDEARAHLSKMSSSTPLSVIAIFGAARQGKSFLMNRLAGGDGCGFAVSNSQDPCTVGVDLASNTVALKDFCSVENDSFIKHKQVQSQLKKYASIRVGFIDVEGQGDRDAAYDARIATPVLLVAKCVIFNWRDSLQKDKLLDQLGVMVHSAQSVQLNENDANSGGGAKPFGHLHIVFRDWCYDGDKESVERQLFEVEPEDKADSVKRNVVRRALLKSFESITVKLLPSPVERVKDLNKVLSNQIISQEFKDAVSDVRYGICEQLISGPRTWSGKSLTGPRISKLVPIIAEALNQGNQVLPSSAFESMIRSELVAVRAKMDEKLSQKFQEKINEISCESSTSIKAMVEKIKSKPCSLKGCIAKIKQVKNELEDGFKTALSDLKLSLESEFRSQVESITDDVSTVSEALDNFEDKLLVEIDKTRAKIEVEVMWPFTSTSGRMRLEALYNDLYKQLPTPIDEVTCDMQELLSTIQDELKSFLKLKMNATLVENEDMALSEKAQSLLQALNDRNEELEESRKDEEDSLCKAAIKALTDKMVEEESSLHEQAAKRNQSPASFGITGDRSGLLTSTISEQLEEKLSGIGSSEARVAELVESLINAGEVKMKSIISDRRIKLDKDVGNLVRNQRDWLRGAAVAELLVKARDITTPVNGVDSRAGLTDLLHELSKATDISISSIAQLLGIYSPNKVEATASSSSSFSSDSATASLDFEQYKNSLFLKSKSEIEDVANSLKIDLQKAKEESNATVRMLLKQEELAAAEAHRAKQLLEEEKLRIEAEAERKRIEKEEKQRQDKLKKEKLQRQKMEEAKAENLRLEKEEKALEKKRLRDEALAEAQVAAEREALRLATLEAEEAASKLAQEKAKAAAKKHSEKMQKLKNEKESYDRERRRLTAESLAAAEEASSDDASLPEDNMSDDEVVPLKTSKKANKQSNETKVVLAEKPSKKSTAGSKKTATGPKKLTVAEAKEKVRREQAERAQKRVDQLSASSQNETNGKRRSSEGGSSTQKRGRK